MKTLGKICVIIGLAALACLELVLYSEDSSKLEA